MKSAQVNPLPSVDDGECIEIMTGAPVPAGADAILMVEHAEGTAISSTQIVSKPGDNISPTGSEACAGETCSNRHQDRLRAHRRARDRRSRHCSRLQEAKRKHCRNRRRTGPIHEHPRKLPNPQLKLLSLAAQIERAGGEVAFQTVAPDTTAALRASNGSRIRVRLSGSIRRRIGGQVRPRRTRTGRIRRGIFLHAGCGFNLANQRFSAERAGSSSLVFPGIPYPPW